MVEVSSTQRLHLAANADDDIKQMQRMKNSNGIEIIVAFGINNINNINLK
jgi:hypothetical protein